MVSIIRNTDTKVVVYVSYGNVTHNESGVSDDSIADSLGFWPTTDGFGLVRAEIEVPEDYEGDKYKLIEDGESYRWELA